MRFNDYFYTPYTTNKMDKIYQEMWTAAFPKIKKGLIKVDDQIDNNTDNRRGITLLIRPTQSIIHQFQQFLQKVQKFAPNQYYYPATDLHLTTLSIFSCQLGFNIHQIDLPTYQALIRQTLKNFPAFQINYSGITLSSSGIVAKGYDETGRLNQIRAALRNAFNATTLPNSMDKRYSLKAAHTTLMRFRQPLKNPALFADFLAQQQNIPFGTMTVQAIDLVANDWYMKTEQVTLLERYLLR